MKIFRFILIFILIMALLSATGFIYARHIEPHLLKTNVFDYEISKVSNIDNLKIVFFSDTHFSDYYTLEDFKKVIEKINNESPDFVFFVGDLIDNYYDYEISHSTTDISDALNQISASIGKYAVYGNHDYGGGAENKYIKIMEDGGFKVLVNESDLLEDYNICISGIDDVLIGYGNPDFLQSCTNEQLNIILCHEPDLIDTLLDYNIDFMFSGHTHGGQINLPMKKNEFLPSLGEKYIRGNFDFDNFSHTKLTVTSGLGTTKLPFRFGAKPEIVVINLLKN